MLKRCMASFMLILCCIFLFGCSTVTSGVRLYVQEDGSLVVEQSVKVEFDKSLIVEAGYDYELITEEVYFIAVDYLDSFHYEYNSRKEEFLTNPKKQKFFRLFSSNYNEDIIRSDDGFYVYRQFASIYDFLLYNNYEMLYVGCPHCGNKIAETEADAEFVSKCLNCNEDTNGDFEYFLQQRIVDFPFVGEITTKEGNFATTYSQEILTTYKDLLDLVNRENEPLVGKLEYLFSRGTMDFTLDDVDLKFQYTTPYSRVHSNGKVTRSKGVYVHTWDIDDLSQTIILYRASANTSTWYLLALVTSVGLCIILVVFAAVKQKLYDKSKEKLALAKEKEKEEHNNLIDRIR